MNINFHFKDLADALMDLLRPSSNSVFVPKKNKKTTLLDTGTQQYGNTVAEK